MPDALELANYYRNSYAEDHAQVELQTDPEQLKYYKRHVKELLTYHGQEREIIIADYGCAYPSFLLVAKKERRIAKEVGIEFDESARNFGKENGIEMFLPQDFFDDYPNESIDIIRFSHALEHCINPMEILEKCVRKLKKGGICYITQPSFPVLKNATIDIELKDCVYPEHLHYFNVYSLKSMVEKCGLKVEKLFTHTNEESVWQEYHMFMDIDFCQNNLKAVSEKGDAFFPKYSNYPYYCGENSYLIARK